MPDPPLAALIMAGGLGTRMRSAVPKHFHPILGRRLVDWVIASAGAAGADPVVVVASPSGRDQFSGQPVTIAVQEVPLGTGDAARSARPALAGYEGDVLVLSGDTPLLTPELLLALVATHRAEQAAATVLTAEPADRASTAASSATARAPSSASSRARTRPPRSSRSPRSTRRSTSSGPMRCGRRSSGCSRRTCRASCT